ncbi:MAG: DNA polymerase III subunit beta [Chlamydiota bacterium]
MKVVVAKIEFISLISKIQNIVSSKPAIPALANVLIEAVNGEIILSATDLTTSMRSSTAATVIEEGAIALPARKFFQLVKELTAPQIKITTLSNDSAEITSGSSVFKIHGMNKPEYPSLPAISTGTQVSMPSSILKELLSKTSFSIAKEDNRYVLTGLLLQIAEKKATFISTDGKRLAKAYANIDIDPSFQSSYILPLKAVEELIKILDDSQNMSCLYLMHDKICLEYGNILLMTKLLAGQYPDVDKVIPESTPIQITLHREELLSLLRQVSLFTTELSGSAHFTFEEGQLGLSATKYDVGEGSVSMPVNYSGPKLEIAFNPFYLHDILRHSKDETVLLSLNNPFLPGVLTDSSTALYVIMPMRLKDIPQKEVHEAEKPAFA